MFLLAKIYVCIDGNYGYVLGGMHITVTPSLAYCIAGNFRWCKISHKYLPGPIKNILHFYFRTHLRLPHPLVCYQWGWHCFLLLQWWEATTCSRISGLPPMAKNYLANSWSTSTAPSGSCVNMLEFSRVYSIKIFIRFIFAYLYFMQKCKNSHHTKISLYTYLTDGITQTAVAVRVLCF